MNPARASLVVFLTAFVLAFAVVLAWPAQAPQSPVEVPPVAVTAVCSSDADCAAWDAYRAEADGNGMVGALADGTCPTFADPTPYTNELGVLVCTVNQPRDI